MKEKFKRYLELSKKFCKSRKEAVGKYEDVLNDFKKGSVYYTDYGSASSVNIEVTGGNRVLSTPSLLACDMVNYIKEYDEFLNLQEELSKHFEFSLD